MLQRFASALFGGGVEELSRSDRAEGRKEEEEEEDWILVDYLGESAGGGGRVGGTMSDWANIKPQTLR